MNLDGTPSATAASNEGDSSVPLGPGEWSDPLGLPLCVVCQNVSCSTMFYGFDANLSSVTTHGVLREEPRVEGARLRHGPPLFTNCPAEA